MMPIEEVGNIVMMNLNDLNYIDGTKIKDSNGNELTIHLLPPQIINMYVEIVTNHPKLVQLLKDNLPEDNYSPEIFFGIVGAYCGIVLDSSESAHGYSLQELYEQLGNALINKRECTAVSVNTVPTVQTLIGQLGEMKEANIH